MEKNNAILDLKQTQGKSWCSSVQIKENVISEHRGLGFSQ
jgi:hypothetical protein